MEGLLAQRYQLETVLGSGGMGTVWRAHDVLLDRQVAIKEVRYSAQLSDSERQEQTTRAVAEARHAARLEHPRIVPIYDVVIHDARPWIVMRFISGRSLEQQVLTHGRLAPAEVQRIARGLLEALAAAHRGGVLHRDVKPSNVLITDDGEPMLTDFSIARAIGQGTATNTGLIVGSPGYIAPERVISGVSGPEADLFGLGATLFFAAEGVAPFAHEDAMVGAFAAAIHPHPRPEHAGPTLTPLLDGLLEKDPRTRLTFAAAAELLGLSAPSLTTAPSPAQPPAPSSSPASSPLPQPAGSQLAPSPPAAPPPQPVSSEQPPSPAVATPRQPVSPEQAPPPAVATPRPPVGPEVPSPAVAASPWPSLSPPPAGPELAPSPAVAANPSPHSSSLPGRPELDPAAGPSPWPSLSPQAEPDTLAESGAFAPGRAEIVIPRPAAGEEVAEPDGPTTWLVGRLVLIALTVILLAAAVFAIGKLTYWSAKDSGATTSSVSPRQSVTVAPSTSPSALPSQAASPTPVVSSTKPSTPKTTAPAQSPFFSPELKTFGAGWQPGMRCQSDQPDPARAIDSSSCLLSPAPVPDVTKVASRTINIWLELYSAGQADDNMGCGAPAYVIPGMASSKVDRPGTSGNRAGFYCETTSNLTQDGNVIGMCTDITWTSGDVSLLGIMSQCFRFSDEGTSFRPTTAMLNYLRGLWNARA